MTPNDPREEERLRSLLHRAVDDVEPEHRLHAIHRLTHPTDRTKVTAMPSPRRSWLVGAIGAAVATAAVITGAVLVTQDRDSTDPVAGRPTGAATDSPSVEISGRTTASSSPTSASSSPTRSSSGSGTTEVMAVYYVGDGPRGPVLFREFKRIDPAGAVAQAAETPQDPDYRTDWQPGDIVSSDASGDTIWVTLASEDLAQRPAGMDPQEAAAAIQSLVYTAQAAYQSRAGVQFLVGDQPMTALLGIPLEGKVKQASVFETLSLMSISDPVEGQHVSGSLVADGVNNGPEADVIWQLKRGGKVVKQGHTSADGWMDEKLFPWKTTISLDGVPAGTYTFLARNDDPSGGEEGNGPAFDTRTVVVG